MAKARKRTGLVSRQTQDIGFARIAYDVDMVPGAANAMTVTEIDLNLTLERGEVVVLHRAEMYLSAATIADLRGQAGSITFGIVGTEEPTDLRLYRRTLYGSKCVDFGALHTGKWDLPIEISWEDLPNMGMAVPPHPLYFALQSTNMTIAGNFNVRLFYSQITVQAPEALDMLRNLIPAAF